MLKDLPWLKHSEGLDIELLESKEEGKDIEGFGKRAEEIKKMENGAEKEGWAGNLLDELFALPVKEGFGCIEPSDLAGIEAERPTSKIQRNRNTANLSDDTLYNKIYGAWLGRCAGCLLGQPVEGWQRERIGKLLKGTGNYPINYYMSSDISKEIKEECDVTDYPGVYGNQKKGWINNIECMPEDDDTNYTIMGLKILEKYGVDFTPEDVAECWLDNLPVLHLCTAERVAYRNLINLDMPPRSAAYRNPYREWIGAQIRADFFGYIAPGNPELSSAMAWRDASISHTKNGIYGEMFIAAMLSTAAESEDIQSIIDAGLSMIPEKSRLHAGIDTVLKWYYSGVDWEGAIDKIHQLYNEKNAHDWCHTIPNAMIVCIGLLYGGLDFGKSIGIAVMAGFDTDCNGATVGSILGMVLGAESIPENWIKPLNNKVKSGIDGYGLVEISDLADRTVRIAKSILPSL
ncbi:ADP-ribosylglycohydrolase [Anaerocolumna jejuensis DSM 15929]|uniref:ADP-ribosylglycohydrolase n=1 Tax=Anaerocolumna jejuensis DSM 15929 TaxID=1121322 RepID=A0A1M7CSV9_9FIRM|nr:ADP-ribosylglycohydrolase family protein [Anaerocolumna jejuensis]SHL70260.1 ADP-ribosylglycohydrolase [Anaerocolumna jejuensis DSM 15929]